MRILRWARRLFGKDVQAWTKSVLDQSDWALFCFAPGESKRLLDDALERLKAKSASPAIRAAAEALLLCKRGRTWAAMGDSRRAQADYDTAAERLRPLQSPERPDLAFLLARLHRERGDAIWNREGRLAAYRLAAATLPPCSDPDDNFVEWSIRDVELASFRRGLAHTLLQLGNANFAEGRLAEAVADCGQAIELFEQCRSESDDDLARAYNTRGLVLRALGRPAEAEGDFSRAIDLVARSLSIQRRPQPPLACPESKGSDRSSPAVRLLAHKPTPKESRLPAQRNDLARAYRNRGLALGDQGRLLGAISDFDRAIALLEGLQSTLEPAVQWTIRRIGIHRKRLVCTLQETPEPSGQWSPDLINDLAMAYSNRATALTALGRRAEAVADYERAIDLRESLRKALDPMGDWTPELQIDLAKDYINRGAANYGERSCEQLVADYEVGFALSEPIASGVLAEADWTRFVLYASLSRLLDHLPDPLPWARAGSQSMVRILEPMPVTQDGLSYAPDLYRNFALFHGRWLAWCVRSGHLDVIPEILALVQGREIAAEMLDQVNVEDRRVPEQVRAYHSLRQELRKLNGRIEALIMGGHDSRLSVSAGFGRRVGALAPIWDPSTYEKLVAEHKGLTEQFESARQKAAGVPGYESLELPYQRLALADLQQRLAAGEALLLLVHPEEGEAGVLLIRAQGEPHWQPVPELPALTRRVRAFARDGRGRGYRRGGTDREALDAAEIPEVDSASFWDTTAERLHDALWAPLAPYLGDVAQLIAVPHGDLHLLPLSAGVPARVTLSRFPGLAFFGLRRGLYGGSAEAGEAETQDAVGLIDFAGPEGDIPLVAAETAALKRLHKGHGRDVYHPSGYPEQDQPMGLLHIACHGHSPDDEDQDPRSHRQGVALVTGVDPEAGTLHLITQEAIIAGAAPPRDLYLSACFGGQTREGLSGTPSGLVSACFRRNARWVAGALVPIPDLWSMVLAVLTHQAMLNEGWALPRALAEGKRRLAAGDWYPDTGQILRSAAPQPFRHWAAVWAQEAWEKLSVEQHRQEYWSTVQPAQLREWYSQKAVPAGLQGWALDQSEVDALHHRLRHHGPETLAEPLAAALAELWPSRPRIPPEPHLGTLIHGLVVFGEPPPEQTERLLGLTMRSP